jgi:hypothetical protein
MSELDGYYEAVLELVKQGGQVRVRATVLL